MAEVALAATDSWVVDPAANGARYRVDLSLPWGRPEQPVPLLVVLDGHTMFFTATEFIRTTNVVTMGTMPPMAVAAVTREEPDGMAYMSSRFRDFTPQEWRLHGPFEGDNAMVHHGTGGADAFIDVVLHEVLPGVRSRVDIDPSLVGICGWSLSGLFASYAWREHPEVFSRLLAISPSLWWNDASMLDEPIATRTEGHRAFVCSGSLEEGDVNRVWPALFGNAEQREMAAMVRNAERFGEMCAASGATTSTVTFDDEHHVTVQLAALARGLVHLYAGR